MLAMFFNWYLLMNRSCRFQDMPSGVVQSFSVCCWQMVWMAFQSHSRCESKIRCSTLMLDRIAAVFSCVYLRYLI